MLKFQYDYTTLIAAFEDFILLVYVIIDDLYQQFASSAVSQRHNVTTAKRSDSEIITLSICSELICIDSEKAWHSFVKRNYRHLFPNLFSGTRFNRTRMNLLQVTENKVLGHNLCMAIYRSAQESSLEGGHVISTDEMTGIQAPYLNPTRTEEDFVKAVGALIDTYPRASWTFVYDDLNTHKSESLVRYVAEACSMDLDLGEKGKKVSLKT